MAVIRGSTVTMSDIYSFRLSFQNPRENQAREVIEAWAKQGYSLRHIITEALLLLDNHETHSYNMDDLSEPIDRLFRLVERLESDYQVAQPVNHVETKLSDTFVSIKSTLKPGIRISD